MKMAYRVRRFCVFGALLCALAGAPAPAMSAMVTIERIIAKVNDKIITLSELQDLVKPNVDKLRKDYEGEELNRRIREVELRALDAMVENRLILERAESLKAEVNEKELENAIGDMLRKNKMTTAQLRRFLSTRGVTFEKYRDDMRERILARKVERREVGARVTVGEQEIADYYGAHTDDYREGETRVARQIFLPVTEGASTADAEAQREKATRAYDEAVSPGADFAAVVQKHSEGPARGRGGLLGALKKGEVFPELEQIIFSTPEGGTSRPTRTRVGYHVVRVEKVNPGKLVTLDRVAGKIRSKIYAEKFSRRRREWMVDLKRGAFLEINYDPGAASSGLSSIFRDVREQVSFNLVGIGLKEGEGLLTGGRIFWAYGSNRKKPRWESDKLSVGRGLSLEKDDIGTLGATHRLFVNPSPAANLYLFRHSYLLPNSYLGKISFADVIKAFSLRAGSEGEKKIAFDTDTGSARIEFEAKVERTRSISADPKEISQ